jgi:hypothetical protein
VGGGLPEPAVRQWPRERESNGAKREQWSERERESNGAREREREQWSERERATEREGESNGARESVIEAPVLARRSRFAERALRRQREHRRFGQPRGAARAHG